MKITLSLILLSSLGFTALGQNQNLSFLDIYKENADLSYTSPLSEIGAPSKYLLSGKLTTTYILFGAKYSRFAISINPDFTVRVRNEKSAGVRTPSFKLGGTSYYRINDDLKNYKYAEFSFTHHSNGQDGKAVNLDGTINTYNGNFSTNYLTATYRFGNSSKRFSSLIYHSVNHKIGLEWHKWFSYEKALEDEYGFTRLLYNFSYRSYKLQKNNSENIEKEYLRINTDISYSVNKIENSSLLNAKRRLNTELTINYSLHFMQNTFLMATIGYYGEDP